MLAMAGLSGLAVAVSAPVPAAAAPGPAFTCTPSLYFQGIGDPTQLYEEKYTPGGLQFTGIGVASVEYNAIGYDPVNNYLYASSRGLDTPPELLQIDSNGGVTDAENFPDLPPDNGDSGFLAATFDDSGDYIATNPAGGSKYLYELNIATNIVNTVTMTLNGSPFAESMVDITYSYGYVWGVDPSNMDIARIDPATGVVTDLPESFLPSGSYGAAWTFGNGNLVFSNNTTGEVYQLSVTNPSSALPTLTGVSEAFGRATSNNDGASCTGPPVDLSIVKAGPVSAAVDSPVVYTLTVTNESGTNDSSGFTVSDPVPAGFTAVTSPTPGCTVTSNDVVCVEGELDAGDSLVITVDATTPTSGGAYTNTATVTGDESDPNPANNTSSVTTDVGFANVTLTKSAMTTSPEVGAADTFTLTLSNSAASTADSGQVVVTDDLNPSLPYQSSTSSNCGTGSCIVVSGQTVTWTIAGLAPGATTTLQINVDVDTSSPVSNTASFTQAFPNSTGATTGTSNTVTLEPAWANVSLTKTASSPNPDVGSYDAFTLVASNSAASTAGSGTITVSDPLPTGLSYALSNPSVGTVGVAGQTVTWTIPNLTAGTSATLQIVVLVTGTSAMNNTATFTQTTPNDTGATTGSSNTVTVTPVYADVTVTKSATTTTPDVGSSDTFTLTATNAGADSSGQVVVSDDVPPGLAITSAIPSAGTVAVTGQTVTWTIPDLAASGSGASATLQIVVVVNITSPVDNTAMFTQTTPNGTGSTTGTSNTVGLSPQWADVSVIKSVSSSTPEVGTPDTFTLTAGNSSASTADSGTVTVTDALPAGLTYVSSTPSNTCTGSCVSVTGQTVTWTIDDLAPGTSATLQIVVTVTGTSAMNNTAAFTQTTPNDTGATTGSSNTVTVTPVYADVAVTKSATTTTPDVGSDDTFTLTATNAGPDSSGQVVVTDDVPVGLGISSETPSAGTVSITGHTVVWTIPDLTASGLGASATLQIIVVVSATSPVANTATFTQTTPNSTGGTTGSSNTVTVTPKTSANVTLTKTAASTDPQLGSDDTFTLTATNMGPSAAGKVVVTDTLAPGLTYVSSSTSIGTAIVSGSTVTWTILDLGAPGHDSSATLQIVVTVETSQPFTNTASFTQTTPSPTGTTSGSSNTVAVVPAYARLKLTKTIADATPIVGSHGTYTIKVTNSGPDTAEGVLVTDPLPSDLAFVSDTTSMGSATAKGQDVDWQIGAMRVGVTATMQLVVRFTAAGKVVNIATATDTTFDRAGESVRASATAEVVNATVVPQAHTGEPWSSPRYWLLPGLLGFCGLFAFGRGRRRRRRPATST
jgi:large repetitive protein